MSGNTNQILLDADGKKISPQELIFKYFSYILWFIISLAISIGVAVIYIRYSHPVYLASAKILVKADNDNTGNTRSNDNDLIDVAVLGGKKVNLENEIELIQSKELIRRVVHRFNLNIQYYEEGNIIHSNIYEESPFTWIVKKAGDSSQSVTVRISNLSHSGGTYAFFSGKESFASQNFNWNESIKYKNWEFLILPNQRKLLAKLSYTVKIQPVANSINEIARGLKVTPFSKNTTIILLKLEVDNPRRGTVILDCIVEEYKQLNIEEKNKVSVNTINFINQRLDLISKELSGVESNLEGFRNKKGVIAPSAQIEELYKDVGDQDKTLLELNIKKRLGEFLLKELQQANEPGKTVPSNIGIDDPAIGALVVRYNEVQLRLERETPLNAPNSLLITDLKGQLEDDRKSLVSALQNYETNIKQQIIDINLVNSKNYGTLNQVPSTERVMKEISRQQSIKEGLYLYLLQNREETEISYSSTVSNYKEIDQAEVSKAPISPDKSKILIIAFIIGILVPAALIFIIDFFNDKIISKDDITKRTSTPFIGEIGHVDDITPLIVNNKARSIISEQFRIVRSNLQFLLKDKKTILITSSISGEGKSFISLNVAAVLAITDKKVALLEFDLRKPRIVANLNLPKSDIGLSNYLIGQSVKLEELYLILPDYPSLHIYNSGPIPPNPAELMLGDRMTDLFKELKDKYDYVIIDSAPIGLVGDSYTIARFTDAVLYIVRQRYTIKSQIGFINDIYENGKLKNMGLIINDVKVGGRYGYYGYGNAYGYGYGYGYGYSYGGYSDNSGYFDVNKTLWLKRLKRFFSSK